MIQIQRDPSRRQLLLFSGLVFPLFGLWVAWLLWSQLHWDRVAIAVVVAAVACGMLGLAWSRFARALWLGTMFAVYPIGFVVSHILLAIVYYGVLTPIGLLMRLLGRDPMHRRFEPELESYFVERRETPRTERYFRQF